MTEDVPEGGRMMFVPDGAYIVYDKEDVHAMFGYNHYGSTRKMMSKHSPGMIIGWPVDEVHEALEAYDPSKSWPRTKGARTRTGPKPEKTADRKPAKNRRKNDGSSEAG